MYARYIPPKKSRSAVAQEASATPVLPPPSTTPVQSVEPATTQLDASQTYARYIPPKRKNPSGDSVTSVKRQKTGCQEGPVVDLGGAIVCEETPNAIANGSGPHLRHTREEPSSNLAEKLKDLEGAENEGVEGTTISTEQKPSKPAKAKKLKVKIAEQPTESATIPSSGEKGSQPSGHTKVLEKRDKALRKAERRAAKEAQRAEVESGDVPEVGEVEAEEPLYDLVPLPQPEPVPEPAYRKDLSLLPSWLASPIHVAPTHTAPFDEVGVSAEVAKGLKAKGFTDAFAVQAAILPLLLPGKTQEPGDIVVSAATGSGKTLAYLLPMIEDIRHYPITKLRALIVVPTRELVLQARGVAEICAAALLGDNRKRVVVGISEGSENFKTEQGSLMEPNDRYAPTERATYEDIVNRKWDAADPNANVDGEPLLVEDRISKLPDHVISDTSKVDILICTPGRLDEHLKSTPGFTLEHLQWLVVDEADKLLGQAYQGWLGTVNKQLGKARVRKMILSATINRDVGQLSGLRLYRPKLVVLDSVTATTLDTTSSGDHILPSLLNEVAIKVEEESDKPLYLMQLLYGLIPPSTQNVLIFTNSNESAVRLARLIALLDPRLANLIGTLTSTTPTSARNATLKAFASSKLTILVASDLVSRGLDLSELQHVINYDVPTSITAYIHRVGRTARAGKEGDATTLYTNKEGRWFWNEIGRGDEITRGEGKKVERGKCATIAEEMRDVYESALEQLGAEAKEAKGRKKA